MRNFIFLTKTSWVEPPRLRHQLARLLVENGNTVTFFEKPRSLFQLRRSPAPDCRPKEDQITFKQSTEFLHHKLRLSPALHYLNRVVECLSISRLMKGGEKAESTIVNFNYDYYFIRDLFPNSKIITVINDDFWCRAVGGWEKPLRWALARTCGASDVVLCVSVPLQEDLARYCSPKLFLPWSERFFTSKSPAKEKNVLLFWGYINNRLDWDYIFALDQQAKASGLNLVFRFVGPVQRLSRAVLKRIGDTPSIDLHPPCPLEGLDLDDVLAGFVPYITGNRADDVTTLPNKAMPMLSMGLPLVITGMPFCLSADFIIRLGSQSIQGDVTILRDLPSRLALLHPSISAFVAKNHKSARYTEFLQYC
jgi:hypothetical protein